MQGSRSRTSAASSRCRCAIPLARRSSSSEHRLIWIGSFRWARKPPARPIRVELRALSDYEALRTVRGRVVGGGDEPAPFALVTLYADPEHPVPVICDAEGAFAAQVPRLSAGVLAEASHPTMGRGRARTAVDWVWGDPRECRNLEITIRIGVAYRTPIKILENDVPAESGYDLSLTPLSADEQPDKLFRGVRHGDEVPLESGAWRLTLLLSGTETPAAAPLDVPVVSELAEGSVEFHVRSGTARILVTRDGRPLPRALVRLEPSSLAEPYITTYSEIDCGNPDVRVRPEILEVVPGEEFSLALTVSLQSTTVRVRPANASRLVGDLIGEVVVLRGPLGALEGSAIAPRVPTRSARVGESGQASFPGLDPGRYEVSFSWPGATERLTMDARAGWSRCRTASPSPSCPAASRIGT